MTVRPRRIAVIGNCHGGVLCKIIERMCPAPEAETRFFKVGRPHPEDAPAWIEDADLALIQASDCAAPKSLPATRGRIVPFPLLTAQFLWPFNMRAHKRNDEAKTAAMPDGLFNHVMCDSQLLRLIDHRDLSPTSPPAAIDDAVETYLAMDYAKLIDLDRLFALAKDTARHNADIVGYDMFTLVERDLRARPVFVTRLHPMMYVLEQLALEILPRIGIPVTRTQVRQAMHDAYDGEEIFVYGAPIHPSVLRHFGIAWPGDPPKFRFNCDGWITARDMAERTIRFDTRQPATELFARVQRGEPASLMLPQIARRVREDPGNATLRLHFGDLLMRFGAQDDAVEHYVAAARLEPDRPGLPVRLVKAFHTLGFGHQPPPASLGVVQSLCAGGAGIACLKDGWRQPEPWGCWMAGRTGCIALACPALHDGGVRLSFNARAFPAYHGQHVAVSVYADDRLATTWTFESARRCGERIVDLPKSDVTTARLRFYVADPASPEELGVSADPRRFGLGLTSFTAHAMP